MVVDVREGFIHTYMDFIVVNGMSFSRVDLENRENDRGSAVVDNQIIFLGHEIYVEVAITVTNEH